MANEYRSQQGLVDELFRLSDPVTITSTARAQVDGADQIIDLGAGVRIDGVMLTDITALTLGSDDKFTMVLEGSNNSNMSSAVPLAVRLVGHATPMPGSLATSTTGRYEDRFVNVQDDTVYRYISLNVTSEGSTESMTYSSYVVPQVNH